MYWSSRDVFYGQSAVSYLEMKKGVPRGTFQVHIFSSIHNLACFTLNISIKYLFTYNGGRRKPPLNMPLAVKYGQ